jgi:hypothetical protein
MRIRQNGNTVEVEFDHIKNHWVEPNGTPKVEVVRNESGQLSVKMKHSGSIQTDLEKIDGTVLNWREDEHNWCLFDVDSDVEADTLQTILQKAIEV